MTDIFSKQKRSEIMSNIRSKDTKIEEKVRKWLYSQGFRYRKNDKRYAGKPDIVIPKYRTIIFVHGCFWHRHEGCKYAYTPKTRVDFWLPKLNGNVQRDKQNINSLVDDGWKVIVIWECELERNFEVRLTKLADEISQAITE